MSWRVRSRICRRGLAHCAWRAESLLFSLVRWAEGDDPASETGDVEAQDLLAAIELTEWFSNEWKRFHGSFSETTEQLEQRRLMEWIGGKGGQVTVRDLCRGPRKYKDNSNRAERALNELVRVGLGRWDHPAHNQNPGPKKRTFVLNDTGDGDTIA